MRFLLGLAAVVVAISASQSLSDEAERSVTSEEGVWSGGYKRGSQSLVVSAMLIDGFGRIDVQNKNWNGTDPALCRYHFSFDRNGIGQTFLNQAVGQPERCIPEFPFSVRRTDADILTMDLDPGLAQILGFQDIPMNASLRPLREEDRRAPVENLDILGLAPGMSMKDAHAILSQRGYKLAEERPANYRTYTEPYEIWGKGENSKPTRDFPNLDIIRLSFSADADWIDEEPRLIRVSRSAITPPDSTLTELVLQQAFFDKYGPSDGQISRENRTFDRAGNHVPGGKCREKGTHQVIADNSTPNRRANISVYCGPKLSAGITGDPATGRVKGYNLSIIDPDEVWSNFWTVWSKPEGDELEAVFKSVSSAGGDAPDL